MENEIKNKQFLDLRTGLIVEQFNILDIKNIRELDDNGEIIEK